MFSVIGASWALLFGMGVIMLGNGLQNSLLGLRADLEGFGTEVTGIVMSCYFVGYIVGSIWTPRMVQGVGHVRVFAALASLSSAAALLHVVFLDPFTWGAMRAVTGFSYAGLYVVAESWLNDRATNRTRGQLLSVYMVVLFGGLALGQLLLNVGDPGGFVLFVLTSVLISVALVPISLTAGQVPEFQAPSRVSLMQLYRLSPLGVIGSMFTGMSHGAIFAMGAVLAKAVGLSVSEVSYFMACFIIGGMLFQWPIGHASDRFDRRQVLTAVTFLAAAVAVVATTATAAHPVALFAVAFVLGGMALPMYSVCLAHTNDNLEPSQMVAASGTLVLAGGVGATAGPTAAAALMSMLGPSGFFWWLAITHAAIGIFALYRMTRRPATPLDEQVPAMPIAPAASAVAVAVAARAVRDQMDRDLARMSKR